MRPVAEGEVVFDAAVEIEAVGIGKLALVAVSGSEHEQDFLVGGDGDRCRVTGRVVVRHRPATRVSKRRNPWTAGAICCGSTPR